MLTVNAYVAADSLIIPMAPEILSLLGVAQIRETIDTVRRCYNSRLKVLGILLNKFNPRLNLNREVLELSEQIAQQLGSKVFESKIRASVAVAEAPAHGESVLTYAPRSKPFATAPSPCGRRTSRGWWTKFWAAASPGGLRLPGRIEHNGIEKE